MKRTPMKRRPRKPKAGTDKAYREWVLRQPCIVTGPMRGDWDDPRSPTVEGHHVRAMTGMGVKPPDRRMVPVLRSIHQRMQGRDRWWREEYAIDIEAVIERLNKEYEEHRT